MIDYAAATVHDLPEIMDLLRECELPADDLTASLLSHFQMARAQGHLVGCVGLELLEGRIALLRSLAVKPAHRGLGIAERLCDDMESHARAAGVIALHLLTTTASGYFALHGFRPVDRGSLPAPVRTTVEFRELCPTTAVAMTKELAVAA